GQGPIILYTLIYIYYYTSKKNRSLGPAGRPGSPARRRSTPRQERRSRVATSRLLEAGLVLVPRVQTPASSVIFAESPIGDRLQPPNLRSRNQDSIARACACVWALAPKSYRPCLRHSEAPTIAPVSPNL
uniref:Uncharacterized protein n=1 Tax=Aegilops tauschii subsp. strangulata TaxID=200361 RepID=A0A453H500_AEGTS